MSSPARVLEEWAGTEVECVKDGEKGAEKIYGGHYSLAVIDCLLPDLSGLRLAELAINENVPVLLMTGHPDIIAKLEAVDLPYLCKPFTFEELLSKSQAVISEARLNIERVRASLATLEARQDAIALSIKELKALMFETARITQSARKRD